MRDVAALAAVSFKTVSRVINQDPTVSAEVVCRVNQAVKVLGYRPNPAATTLRRADCRTKTIGLLLEDVANPVSSALHRAVEDVARERGLLVLAGSSDEDPDREREVLTALLAHQVDALIVVCSIHRHGVLLLERCRSGLPMVFLDRPAPVPDMDSVTADHREGVRAAVIHLARYGHRRIAFLGGPHSTWTAAECERGYLEALTAAGIRADQTLVRRDIRNGHEGLHVTRGLLATADPPTAFFTAQTFITIGALRGLHQCGLQHRVALVGYGDVQLGGLVDPPVSVVVTEPTALGQTAAHLLLNRLDGNDGPTQHVVVPPRLVARGSGEIPARRGPGAA
jgi:LacI family transcriptional regulator